MYVHFYLHYRTLFGEQIGIQIVKSGERKTDFMLFQTIDGENWTGVLDVKEKTGLSYNYVVYKNGKISVSEWGKPRQILVRCSKCVLRRQMEAKSQ